ncbi:sigma-70 family RNA polymerase sigma factor [Hydrogenophaga sp. BPS33]|uniref:sigma-70 family RNA polymerase sigma factor n=1 Tax=Hydrogenophaga sp. BPS33 TaxID=2651974 RepID=UPI00131F6F5A|nr:sigma-70 family RNA polymerase sigma factor [Hydrogenophaga sp. BPS33]QHE83636.1 sigma-70 family RNA polymerase sigma factor [Hydrogenophaga sp. BPS33]
MFDHYYRELFNFLALKLRDRDAAADLAQESFARVYAAQRSGTAIRDPRALLYRIARNLLTDRYRRHAVRAGADAAAPLDEDADRRGFDVDEQAGPAALEPETALAVRQRFEAIAAIVDSLPPRCREAFILVKFDGLSHAEAAIRMGIAVKTVEMQVQIALNACWDRLDALERGAQRGGSERPRRERGRKPEP